MSAKKTCLVIGAGDATGAGIAKRFAKGGYHVCLTRRPRHLDKLQALADEIIADGGTASAHGVDAREEEAMVALFDAIERDIGPLDVVIFNIGANVAFPIRDTTARVFTKVWEMACFAGFIAGREAARVMVPRGQGTILFTGATASVRGGAGFAAFAAAKHGLRAVAQSCARELAPEGIHVAHLLIDGPINTEWTSQNVPNFKARLADDNVLQPASIGETYWQVHQQTKDAWTFELDARPWKEQW
ncbi:MAG: SDR family NAD(P)-dependent oxidoreductase [Alphaproteobacteria bacterium]